MNAIAPARFRGAFLDQVRSFGEQTVCDEYRGDSRGSFTRFMNRNVLPKVAEQLGLIVEPEHSLKNRGRLFGWRRYQRGKRRTGRGMAGCGLTQLQFWC
jgi:hypothetical protein